MNKKTVAFDTCPEMLSVIIKGARESADSEAFMDRLSSKAYTTARLKRAMMYSMFGIKRVDCAPRYTRLLGMDETGRCHLNKIRSQSKLVVITKHSDIKKLRKRDQMQIEKSYLADSLYNTFLKNPISPSEAYKTKPIIK